ncbi:RidA family protein [Pasteurella sp. PK-2025]|uniref:RidA family protein n=1 Tax=unclassified Pasteurella TaxID=2621516 RepID=UPI003C71E3B7
MGKVQRFHSNERLSEMAIYNGVIYLSGQVPEKTIHSDAYEQTKEVLGLIDKLLAEVRSHKSNIIRAQIYLANMNDYEAMNRAWDEWVDPHAPPARATVEAKLADPHWKVEILITAII